MANAEQIEELISSIEKIITEIQRVRLGQDLSKMTQVRLVDLQYSAKLALENLNQSVTEEEEEVSHF